MKGLKKLNSIVKKKSKENCFIYRMQPNNDDKKAHVSMGNQSNNYYTEPA